MLTSEKKFNDRIPQTYYEKNFELTHKRINNGFVEFKKQTKRYTSPLPLSSTIHESMELSIKDKDKLLSTRSKTKTYVNMS